MTILCDTGERYLSTPLFADLPEPRGVRISGHERQRYDCQLVLKEVGERGQDALRAGSVLVVGAGGLGAPVLFYLAAAGVGRIGIVDDDVVELSNLQRQILFTTADIGRPKAEVAAERLARAQPRGDARAAHRRACAPTPRSRSSTATTSSSPPWTTSRRATCSTTPACCAARRWSTARCCA